MNAEVYFKPLSSRADMFVQLQGVPFTDVEVSRAGPLKRQRLHWPPDADIESGAGKG